MNLRHLVLVAMAGPGAAVLLACGSGTTLQAQPAASTQSSGVPQVAAATHPVVVLADQSGSTPSDAANAAACDTTPWTGAINPQGRPDGLDAGDAGAVYVWHDADGWHIRTTDRRPVDHHYTGTIRLAPAAASFTAIRTVRDERDDRVTVDGDNVLRYDFHTYASVDGADFRVSCRGVRRELLTFHTDFDGHPIADRVRIGDHKQSPPSADFSFVRQVVRPAAGTTASPPA